MNKQISKRVLAAAFAATLLGGCATTANNPKDPYEGFNRAMFAVNEGLDVVIKPVAKGYDIVAPAPVKTGIGNFFGNLQDIWTAFNNFLQGKGGSGLSDVGRVLINTTLGIGGVFDVAREMGLEKHAEDFGQTLGKWGVADGPYLYWPLIGPRTTLRAAWKADPMKPAIPPKTSRTVFPTLRIAPEMELTTGEMIEFHTQLKAVPTAAKTGWMIDE